MLFTPLAHGSAGYFDEVILAVEMVVALLALVYFIRTRRKGPAPAPPPEKNPAELPSDPS